MLKVGDKLLCKKNSSEDWFIAGKCYPIVKIETYPDYSSRIWVSYNNTNSDWFNSNKNDNWCIWDQFYTPQEVRKMKLKQLNA